MRRNVSGQFVGAQLNSKTDGSAVTSGTTTVYVTGDAGTQAAGSVGSGACTHEGQGFWTYAPAQAETNYTHVAFTFVNTSSVNATVQIWPTAYDANGRVDVGSVGGTAQTAGDIYARLGAPAGASMSADIAAIKSQTAAIETDTGTDIPASLTTIDDFLDTEIAAIKAKTDLIPAAPASTTNITSAAGITLATGGVGTGDIDSTALNEIADAVLDRVMSAGADSGGNNTTARTVRQALRTLRNKVTNAAGTLTVYKEDDTTTSFTAATATTAGDPISSIDPT